MPKTQFPSSLNLGLLDGISGVQIYGISQGDTNGQAVSNAGDVNGDGIDDIIIGTGRSFVISDCQPPRECRIDDSGVSYVVFGSRSVNQGFSLSTLDGLNGFQIPGFKKYGRSGWSVSGAGDINNDGYADLIVAEPYIAPGAGSCYVIFGNPTVGGSGLFNVTDLNGVNGFQITGLSISPNIVSGYSVSNIGDINNDNIPDLIIGDPNASPGGKVDAGASYVIFGKSNVGGNGLFNLASLDGSNGFQIPGLTAGDKSGYSVSHAGDINGDNIDDVIMGAPYASPGGKSQAGSSYVIFGKSNIGGTGRFDLTTLDGVKGFQISGILANDQSGTAVSSAGDINADGSGDLIIGAPKATPASKYQAGASYVVFGKTNIGGSGLLELSTLDGNKGFQIPGLIPLDQIGFSVSYAGDLNADGIADIVIGAPYVFCGVYSKSGVSYVVFGQPNIGKGGVFDLSSLDGIKGIQFNLCGIYNGNSGFSVSSAGDFNADGFTDLIIGAPATATPGVSFMVFGDTVATLTRNNMTLSEGQTVVLNNHHFNFTYNKYPSKDTTLRFDVSKVQHGSFRWVNNPGSIIDGFLAQDLRLGKVQFVHDGSKQPPAYDVTIRSLGLANVASVPQSVSIKFNYQQSYFLNNTLIINQGYTVALNSNNLRAMDPAHPEDDLLFTVTDLEQGFFTQRDVPSLPPVTSFNQRKVQAKNIQFTHDGSEYPPSYQVSFTKGGLTTGPQPAKISFNYKPRLVKNQLAINQDQTLVLNSGNLSAIDRDDASENLEFIVDNVRHGKFILGDSAAEITRFTQGQVQKGKISFKHSGTPSSPSYNIIVSDGKMNTLPEASNIKFYPIPVISRNQLTVKQGESVILTPFELYASDDSVTPDEEFTFTVNDVQFSHFEMLDSPAKPVMTFSQKSIMSNNSVKFVTDGSDQQPSYNVKASSGRLVSKNDAAKVKFIPNIDPQKGGGSTSHALRDGLISAGVSGVVGLGFFALKTYLERKAAVSLQSLVEGAKTEGHERLITFQREVLRPIAERIFKQIRTANIIGYRSSEDTTRYIKAIEDLLGQLVVLKVDLDIKNKPAALQNQLFSTIVQQIREHVVKKYDCCTCGHIGSFFKVEMTPQMLENKLENIATSIAKAIPDSLREQPVGRDGIELKERKADRKVMEV